MNGQLKRLLGKSESELLGSTFLQSMSESGERTEYDDAIYYDFPKDGVAFDIATDEGQVVSIIITCESYKEALPFSLSVGMSSAAVRGLLGMPTTTGGGKGTKGPLGPLSPWERYEWEQLAMNVTYEQDRQSIKTICLMLPSAIPRE